MRSLSAFDAQFLAGETDNTYGHYCAVAGLVAPPVNLTISNVSGPPARVRAFGCRLAAHYPASLVGRMPPSTIQEPPTVVGLLRLLPPPRIGTATARSMSIDRDDLR